MLFFYLNGVRKSQDILFLYILLPRSQIFARLCIFLFQHSTRVLAHGLPTSRLGDCNAILFALLKNKLLSLLQMVQMVHLHKSAPMTIAPILSFTSSLSTLYSVQYFGSLTLSSFSLRLLPLLSFSCSSLQTGDFWCLSLSLRCTLTLKFFTTTPSAARL